MRTLVALLLASTALATQALAKPAATPDADIRVVSYSPVKRTTIIGVVGQPSVITFPAGEQVYRVVQTSTPEVDGSLSDAGWQGPPNADIKDTPLGNNLPLWPSRPGESTMTVITKTDTGVQKVYPFRLIAKAADDGGDPVYNLIFKGGTAPAVDPEERHARVEQRRERRAELERVAAVEQLRAGYAAGCHYVAKGRYPSPITPLCPLSNGQWVVMRFPGLSKKPAAYIVGNDGSERLARQHGAGDFVVVEELAAHFRLRLGPDVLDIIDQALNPAGADPGTGTLAPGVTRQLLQAGK
jgi:type IV secretory pathway VirB9-like protein